MLEGHLSAHLSQRRLGLGDGIVVGVDLFQLGQIGLPEGRRVEGQVGRKSIDPTAAERQRRHRDRVRRDVKLVRLEINGDDLDALNDAGLVAWNENDTERLAEAVRTALDEWRDGR